MWPASDSFFCIPELISHLIPFLPRRSLLHLSRTNRTLYSICTPALWRDLTFTDPMIYRRLFDSPEGLKAFSNNSNSVRSIVWDTNFSWYYINALWKYLKSTSASEDHKAISTIALSYPSWGRQNRSSNDNNLVHPLPLMLRPTAYTSCFHYRDRTRPYFRQNRSSNDNNLVHPLPPMLRLTAYTSCFRYRDRTRPYFQTAHAHITHEPQQHQLLWFVRLNRSTLTHLRLNETPLMSVHHVRDVCRTISQLDHLRSLQLDGPSYEAHFSLQFLKMLFFSCPTSLVELSVVGTMLDEQEFMDLEPKEDDWDFNQGSLLLRQEPLHHLRNIELPEIDGSLDYFAVLLCSFLKHCPALKRFEMPDIEDVDVVQAFVTTIRDCCPNITHLSIPEMSGEAVMAIIGSIQEPQLESIYVHSFVESTPSAFSIATITRHSETLREIKFRSCQQTESLTLQAILVTCRVLEVLEVQDYSVANKNILLLEDAVATEWACTGIQHLEITVKFTLDGRNPEYFADPTRVTWNGQDHHHLEMLDKFYTQIGSLAQLAVLNIKSAGVYFQEADGVATAMPYQKTSLPGLLALEDEKTGQIGFLSRWSGLNKLRKLQGSVLWMTSEARARMGKQEVEWFATHLPALEYVEFVDGSFCTTPSDDIPVLLQELHERRPNVRLDYPMLGYRPNSV